MTELCREAISIIKEVVDKNIQNDFSVEQKAEYNYVTSIDHQIEDDLKIRLRPLLSGAGFVSEESDAIEGEYQWIIDPIDGTTNFLNGWPYSTSVALKKSDKTLLGIVYSPQSDELYYSCGEGSYLIQNGIEREIHTRNNGITIFGIPYDRSKVDMIFDIAKEFLMDSADLKRIGPASMDICRVASGQANAYVELDLKEWDISAGILILEQAGGHYMNIQDVFIFKA